MSTTSERRFERRDTAANHTSNNSYLESGEWGVETDTGKAKLGPGYWNSLPYAAYTPAEVDALLDDKLDASAVSTFGGTIIDDADQATARTTLGLDTVATQQIERTRDLLMRMSLLSLSSGGAVPFAAYPLDEIASSAVQSLTALYPLTVVGSPTVTTRSGTRGINFPGSTSHYCYTATSLTPPALPFTLSTWIRTSTSHTGMTISLSNSGDDNEFAAIECNSAVGINVVINGASGGYRNCYGSTVSTIYNGNWHHLVGIFRSSGTTREAWLDGTQIATSTGTTTPSLNRIGVGVLSRPTLVEPFHGDLWMPMVLPFDATPAMIAALYKLGSI